MFLLIYVLRSGITFLSGVITGAGVFRICILLYILKPGAVQQRRAALKTCLGRAGGIWEGCACACLRAQESAVRWRNTDYTDRTDTHGLCFCVSDSWGYRLKIYEILFALSSLFNMLNTFSITFGVSAAAASGILYLNIDHPFTTSTDLILRKSLSKVAIFLIFLISMQARFDASTKLNPVFS